MTGSLFRLDCFFEYACTGHFEDAEANADPDGDGGDDADADIDCRSVMSLSDTEAREELSRIIRLLFSWIDIMQRCRSESVLLVLMLLIDAFLS